MGFDNPQALWLAALVPLAGTFFWLAWRRERAWIGKFGEKPLFERTSDFMPASRYIAVAMFVMAGLTLLILAIARPIKEHGWTEFPHGKVDVVAVIDVSRSMAVPDYQDALKGVEGFSEGRRLDIARHTIMNDIIGSLSYNRLGVVTYAGKAMPLAFITDDMLALRWSLNRAITMGSAPGEGSNMLEAFDMALRMFELDSDEDHKKIIVLFSDGGNDADIAGLHKIVDELAKRDIELMIVGCGKPIASKIPIKLLSKGDQQRFYDYEFYEHEGQVITSKLEENPLLLLRNRSGARYTRMVNPGDFSIGTLIRGVNVTHVKGKEEFFPYFLAGAFVFLLTALAVTRRPRGKKSSKASPRKDR